MPHVYERSIIHILDWFHRAELDLLGHPVVTFNGEAGTVKAVTLDEIHGLRFTMDEEHPHPRRRWYPVATIKFHGDKK